MDIDLYKILNLQTVLDIISANRANWHHHLNKSELHLHWDHLKILFLRRLLNIFYNICSIKLVRHARLEIYGDLRAICPPNNCHLAPKMFIDRLLLCPVSQLQVIFKMWYSRPLSCHWTR